METAAAIKNWKETFNSVTKSINYSFIGKFVRFTEPDYRENSNSKKYRLCVLEIPHPIENSRLEVPGQIFEGNINRAIEDGNPVQPGKNYLVTGNYVYDEKSKQNRLYFTMSHLQELPSGVTMESLGVSLLAPKELETAPE